MERAVLFADVAGSTALYEALGDEKAFALVQACLSAMSACTDQARGRVIKTIGDAVMSVFDSADQAAAAATAMQLQVERLGPALGVRLSLRIGFHVGPVVEHDHDVFGDTVNLASRLCDLASKGQIVTDEDSARRLSGIYAAGLHPLYAIPVKGKEREIGLIEIGWQPPTEDRTIIVARRPSASNALLELDFDGKRTVMGPERRKVTFGRDPQADISMPDLGVSRAHAMIERRRDRFVLVDHSANGTFVTFEGRPELKAQHEEMPLFGHGWISLGQPFAEATQTAEFRCLDGQHRP